MWPLDLFTNRRRKKAAEALKTATLARRAAHDAYEQAKARGDTRLMHQRMDEFRKATMDCLRAAL